MATYYNFSASPGQISYEPYLYDKFDTLTYFIIGAVLIVGGVLLTTLKLFEAGTILGGMLGIIFLVQGLYRLLLRGKSRLIFDKANDALYLASPLGKKKLIALSNVYDIFTVTENMSYSYQLTDKSKPSAKSIAITSYIGSKRGNAPEGIFLKEHILPAIQSLLASVG